MRDSKDGSKDMGRVNLIAVVIAVLHLRGSRRGIRSEDCSSDRRRQRPSDDADDNERDKDQEMHRWQAGGSARKEWEWKGDEKILFEWWTQR